MSVPPYAVETITMRGGSMFTRLVDLMNNNFVKDELLWFFFVVFMFEVVFLSLFIRFIVGSDVVHSFCDRLLVSIRVPIRI